MFRILESVQVFCMFGQKRSFNWQANLSVFAKEHRTHHCRISVIATMKRGIEKNDMGYACAVGMVLLVIALAINIVQLVCNGTFKREED